MAVRDSRVDQSVVVLGHEADRIREEVDLGGATVVLNEVYEAGMSASIRTGLSMLDPQAEAVFVILGDQPLLSPETLNVLITARVQSGAKILVPTFRGVRGNPVLLDRALTPEMESLTGDVGCRGIFHRHPAEVLEVPVEDPGVLLDLDTEEQVRRVEQTLQAGGDLGSLVVEFSGPARPTEGEQPVLPRQVDVLSLAEELRSRGEPFTLATVVRAVAPSSGKPGFKALIRPDGRMEGWIGGGCSQPAIVAEALEALRDGRPRLLRFSNDGEGEEGVIPHRMECESGGAMDVFVEPHAPPAQLVLVGDSPVVEALSALGGLLGYRVVVAAPGAAREGFPQADRFLPELEGLAKAVHRNTYAVVASMGRYDQTALELLARHEIPYLALVGSRRRAQATREALRKRGLSEETVARIRNPAGLDLGAVTQEEIALSIMAEITQGRRTSPPGSGPVAEPREAPGEGETDPVCGMKVARASPLRAVHEGTEYRFCSETCLVRFEEDPEAYG